MPLLDSLSRRCRLPEVMDQPGLDPVRHRTALAGLARINSLSGSAGMLWPPLVDLAKRGPGRPLRVLDLACGGGDVTLGLWQRARRARMQMEIAGCDLSPTALEFAARRARQAGADIQFFRTDLLRDPLPLGYDALVCSLFLHHLADDEAMDFLRRVRAAARRLALVNDLVRSRTGLVLAHLAGRLLARGDVVRIDAPLSVRAAFTCAEAAEAARRAGLDGATVEPRWPSRFLMAWRKPKDEPAACASHSLGGAAT